jgi:hypothetical protein
MGKFETILTVGGKTNSLGRADEVLNSVLEDKAKLEELYACLFHSDAWVRMRAADCLEKICRVHPEWIEPYIDKIFTDLAGSTQPSIQWHLAQIFAEVSLTAKQTKQVILWLKERLSSTEVDWIVSVNSMKTLLQFYQRELVSKQEIESLFELQNQHKSKSVRKKATQFLEIL